MRLTNSRDIERIQRETESFVYGDTANLLSDVVNSLDGYGQPSVTTTTTAIECSFTDTPNVEAWEGMFDIEQLDAEIRFSTPTPANGNRIVLTGRWDDSTFTDSSEYEIVGIQDRGTLGYLCALKRVEI